MEEEARAILKRQRSPSRAKTKSLVSGICARIEPPGGIETRNPDARGDARRTHAVTAHCPDTDVSEVRYCAQPLSSP